MPRSSANTTPTLDSPPTLSANGKRKKMDEKLMNSNLPKKKPRTRVSYSCGECHRRKQKCDRQTPCSHCVARKVPELCKQYTPGKSEQDVHARLARLEHIIETALPHLAFADSPQSPSGSGHHRSRSVTPDDEIQSQPDEDGGAGTFQGGGWFGPNASGTIASAALIEQLQNIGSSSDVKPTFSGRNGMRRTEHDTALLDTVRQGLEPSPADKLKILFQECGVSPHKVSELLQELPTRRFSDVLLDYYFVNVNWHRYPLSEDDFRASYSALSTNAVAASASEVRFLPLLFVVLAIAVRLAPENIAGDERTRRLTSLRYYWSSRSSVLIAAAIQPDSIEMVLTRLLSARFLTFDRRITECWSQLGAAVRTAQALGLHRDGASMGLDPVQAEYRRRIWAYLYHADRSYAMFLGRPTAIQDDYSSTLCPSNIEDLSSITELRPRAPPLSQPCRMTWIILRHKFAAIMGRIVHHFQKTKSSNSYAEVVALDDEIQEFIRNLPSHFAMVDPDTSLDEQTDLSEHRVTFLTEILFVRMNLHRPYILRRLGSDKFERSRVTCFESAMKDFELREGYKNLGLPLHYQILNKNSYREFQTTMIAGIYLIIHPDGPHVDAMHVITDSYLREHEGVRDLDDTSRRDKKIIEFLKMKAANGRSDVSSSRPEAPSALLTRPMEAQLLLGLHQSNIRSTGADVTEAPTSMFTPMALDAPVNHAMLPALARVGNDDMPSVSGSGSPNGDEESTAQYLLDQWCNHVSNGVTSDTDPAANMQWGTTGADMMTWPAGPPGELSAFTGLGGSDWNYWETLVNQIRGEPQIGG